MAPRRGIIDRLADTKESYEYSKVFRSKAIGPNQLDRGTAHDQTITSWRSRRR